MSVHNGAVTLRAAINSLLWQTFTDWELVIVNDASTDATSQICRQFRDCRIKVIDELQQKGLAARLNQCVEQARGKYVARMDADDIAYPKRFERQVRYLEAHPDIDLLGHGALLFTGSGEVVGLYPTAERHEEICRRPWWGFPLAHPTWMGKRSWFTQHRYDDHLRKGQDQELLLRAWRTSRFACLPDCLLGYRVGKVSSLKSIIGRGHYCCSLLSQVHDRKSAELLIRGVFVHGLALARDVVLDLMDISGSKIRQSLGAPNAKEVEQWREVFGRSQEFAS